MSDGAAISAPESSPAQHTGDGRMRNAKRVHSDEVWTAAREDYMVGISGPEVARRYGIALSTFRYRAAAEGWRRHDSPSELPDDEGGDLEASVEGDVERLEYFQLASVAHARMKRAILRGDAGQAIRWRRVEQIMHEEQQEINRLIREDEEWHAMHGAR